LIAWNTIRAQYCFQEKIMALMLSFSEGPGLADLSDWSNRAALNLAALL